MIYKENERSETMGVIIYDYSKLLGRIKEKGFTQVGLAVELGVSETTLNLSLGNKRAFKQDEIIKICSILKIPFKNINDYFFLPQNFRNLKNNNFYKKRTAFQRQGRNSLFNNYCFGRRNSNYSYSL